MNLNIKIKIHPEVQKNAIRRYRVFHKIQDCHTLKQWMILRDQPIGQGFGNPLDSCWKRGSIANQHFLG